MFTGALFTIAKIRTQPKCPSVCTHTHTHTQEYYSVIKKGTVILPPVTRRDPEDIIPYDLIYM